MNTRGPIEDPSPAACATRLLNLGQTESFLSYKATSSLIASSHCCFSNWDVDSHLLALLKVYCHIFSFVQPLGFSTMNPVMSVSRCTCVSIVVEGNSLLLYDHYGDYYQ